ncbi:MAG: polysaccharide deacetylase family protein [Pirellulales bacterium]
MIAVTLMYHDVVDSDKSECSGFTGNDASRYKISRQDFIEQLRVFREAGYYAALVSNDEKIGLAQRSRIFLTFDDGGASSLATADLLETYGFRGHFFVTTDCIGSPRFVTVKDVAELAARGHIVGSHSASHPSKISSLDAVALTRQWLVSTVVLEQILGQQVCTASVPGGYYSRNVVIAASKANIRFLFNSEPTIKCYHVNGCKVLGRFTIMRSTSIGQAMSLTEGTHLMRSRQFFAWNSRKCVKCIGGTFYETIRKSILNR